MLNSRSHQICKLKPQDTITCQPDRLKWGRWDVVDITNAFKDVKQLEVTCTVCGRVIWDTSENWQLPPQAKQQ